MNDELSKAIDGALSDAAEMGNFTVDEPCGRGVHWHTDIRNAGNEIIGTTYGHTESEALRRARLIVESVNGRGAMAQRIAELEAALGKIIEDYSTPGTGHYHAWDVATQALSAKGGAALTKNRIELIEIPLESPPPEVQPIPLRDVPVGGRFRFGTDAWRKPHVRLKMGGDWRCDIQNRIPCVAEASPHFVGHSGADSLVYPIPTSEPPPAKRPTHAELRHGDLALRADGLVVRWNKQFGQWFYQHADTLCVAPSDTDGPIPAEIVALCRVQVVPAKGGA